MEIVIDFDGTCVKHMYPDVGEDIGAVPVLKKLVARGDLLILSTMRSGRKLEDAVKWFADHEIPLYGIGTNPTQHEWTSSTKPYGQLYIDDCGLNIPLVVPEFDRPYVDWKRVDSILFKEKDSLGW
jgi:hypothetical protein